MSDLTCQESAHSFHFVLDPPKPSEENWNKLEAAYCAAEGAN